MKKMILIVRCLLAFAILAVPVFLFSEYLNDFLNLIGLRGSLREVVGYSLAFIGLLFFLWFLNSEHGTKLMKFADKVSGIKPTQPK